MILLFFCRIILIYPQVIFQERATGANSIDVHFKDNGNFYWIGEFPVIIFEIDNSGNQIWNINLYSDSVICPRASYKTKDEGIVIAGICKWDNNYNHIAIIKTDSSGNTEWAKEFGKNDFLYYDVYKIIQTDDNGFVLTGVSNSFDILICKLDSLGNKQWIKSFCFYEINKGYSIIQTKDGNFMTVGFTRHSTNDPPDICLFKVDQYGNQIWSKMYSGTYTDVGSDIIELNNGNILLVGETSSLTDSSDLDICVLQIDSVGNIIWSKIYGSAEDDLTANIIEDDDSTFCIIGLSAGLGFGNYDILLMNINNDGSVNYCKTYGGVNDDYAPRICKTNENGYMISGSSDSFGSGLNDYEMYLIKTDATGNSGCNEETQQINYCSVTFNPITTSAIHTSLPDTLFDIPIYIDTVGMIYDICHGMSGIINTQLKYDFKFIPNPFSSYTSYESTYELKGELKIYDFQGKILRSANINGYSIKIFREDLDGGIYFYQYIDGDNSSSAGKLIIE